MNSNNMFNNERVNTLYADPNAYVMKQTINQQFNQNNTQYQINKFNQNKANQHQSKLVNQNLQNVNTQTIEKVLYPEPYQNASPYYNKYEFAPPPKPEPPAPPPQNFNQPMFDIKSLLPMLMSGKMNDMLKPIMSMFGGGNGKGLGDISKVFELFKPKKKETQEEPQKSKFDDMIIIEE